MRVLVGILHSGESEFDACIESLGRQSFAAHEHFVIQDQPNKLAHDTLYRRFMDEGKSFDLLLKLDADMTFFDDGALQKMVDLFAPGVGHLLAYVNDEPSGIKIPAIQMFRAGTSWPFDDEPLNVDYKPVAPGRTETVIDADLIRHMPAPSAFQLFRYGIHKALKALQPDRPLQKKSVAKALLHITILQGMARNYFAGCRELFPALLDATLVFDGSFRQIDYNSAEAKALFDHLSAPDETARAEPHVRKLWRNEYQSNLFWWNSLNKMVW